MLAIKEFDECYERRATGEEPTPTDKRISVFILTSYLESKQDLQDLINFRDVPLKRVKGICKNLSSFGVKEITMTLTGPDSMEIYEEFEKCGFKLKGLKTIYLHRVYGWDPLDYAPALHFVKE